jgi:hypothetical protein
MNNLEREVIRSYQIKHDFCKQCKEEGKKRYPMLEPTGPISFFGVGERFENDFFKVLFVGKNTWYNKDDAIGLKTFSGSDFKDAREDGRDLFEHNCSAFWRCIREITQRLYPQFKKPSRTWDYKELWEHIAVTNLTKCNTSTEIDYGDTTPYYFTEQCIQLFEEEVTQLQPKHMILFTGKGYDHYITKLSFIEGKNFDEDHQKIINGKAVWWLEGRSLVGNEMFFLRTCHPQGAPKGFREEVVAWIKKHQSKGIALET